MKYFISLLLTLIFSTTGFAQSLDALRKTIEDAQKEIKINNDLLEKNQKNQKLNLTQLKLTENKITSRKKIINSLQAQINITDKDIRVANNTINKLKSEINILKQEYSQMLYSSYKNYKLNNFLTFLFASDDFNDVTRRVSFMKRYNKTREQKAIDLQELTISLNAKLQELHNKMEELSSLKTQHSQQLNTYAGEQKKYLSQASELKSSHSKISKQVKEKQDQINKAQNQIQKIIAEEARKARELAKKQSESEKQIDIKLSGEFAENKGKLPYPVSGGVIIDSFGVHAHPTQKGLTVNNKGINIAGERSAEVKCVFDGVVTRVFFFKGLNNNVMVRHGNYITVYSNLASVDVKTGDNISTNQIIGKLADTKNSEDWMLHFEIWKETTNLNPTQWLRR